MTPVWRVLSAGLALLAGFTIPIFVVIAFVGVMDLGPIAITGLIALGGAVTLLLLYVRGRLQI